MPPAKLDPRLPKSILPPRGRPPTVQKPKRKPAKHRLSEQLSTALNAMATEGLTIKQAAERGKMQYASLRDALRKPHIVTHFNQLVSEVRKNAGQSAFLRINHLGSDAKSETVRLEANKWVAGVDNIAPVKRVEAAVNHRHSFAGFDYGTGAPLLDTGATIDHAPLDDASSEIVENDDE